MKKGFLFTLFVLLFLLIFPKAISAQNSFVCICVKDSFGNCTTWDVAEAKCDPEHEPNPSSCKYDNSTQPCIRSSSIKQIAWGDTCEPNSAGNKCSNENTTCIRSSDNTFKCLYRNDALSIDQPCKDDTECIGHSSAFSSRCGNKLGSDGPVCQTVAAPKGELCSDTSGGVCKSSCPNTDHPIYKAIDCKGSTPICCAPNPKPAGGSIIGLGGIYFENLECRDKSINTAIGCIPYNNIAEFAGFFIKWSIGIGSGIAFLLILYAGFMVMTSTGNPQRLKAGQELLTAAITGLVMLIFSVFILRVIGVDILKLPGLSQ